MEHILFFGVCCAVSLSVAALNIRLSGSFESHEGRVEIKSGRLWTIMCNKSWSLNEAEVVCRQLNFETAFGLTLQNGLDKNLLDDLNFYHGTVKCTGNEASIDLCVWDAVDEEDGCGADGPATVVCKLSTDGMLSGFAEKMSQDLWMLTTSATKSDEIKAKIHEAKYKGEHVNGSQRVMRIKYGLEKFFANKIKLAEDTVEAISKLHDDWYPGTEVNSMTDLDNDSFIDGIFPSDWIHRYPLNRNRFFGALKCNMSTGMTLVNEEQRANATVRQSLTWLGKVHSIFTENFKKDPDFRWQYLTSVTGVFNLWPAYRRDRNHIGVTFFESDRTSRPWYISAVTRPKDVVIVLDTSFSMKDFDRLAIARRIIKKIFDTLSKSDLVNIIVSSSTYWADNGEKVTKEPRTLSCRSNIMVQATDPNKKQLLSAVNEVRPDGASNMLYKGVSLAVDLLKGPWSSTCEPLIVILTDAEYHDGHDVKCRATEADETSFADSYMCIFDWSTFPNQIRDVKFYHDFNAKILLFAIETKGYVSVELQCAEDVMHTVPVKKDDDLSSAMKEFLRFMKHKKTYQQAKVGLTSPYIDIAGLGPVFTLSAAVFSRKTTEFLGVVGLDVSLGNVASLLLHEAWGNAYGFMINTYGDAVIHPSMNNKGLLFPDISTLETYEGKPEGFESMVNAMIRKETGDALFYDTFRHIHHRHELVLWEKAAFTQYFYTGITGTEYSIALALTGDDIDFLYPTPIKDEGEFHLMEGDISSNYNYTGMKLAPRAYCQPFQYINNLTMDETNLYYLTKYNRSNEECDKIFIRTAPYYDAHLNKFITWVDRDAKFNKDIAYTYFGTRNGIFVLYPSNRVSRSFDHTRRPWYHNTVLNKDKTLTASSVYTMDSTSVLADRYGLVGKIEYSVGKIVTISMPVEESLKSASNDDDFSHEGNTNQIWSYAGQGRIHGVLGIDLKYDAFHKLVNNVANKKGLDCGDRCYIVDAYSNIIYDPFIKDSPDHYPHLFMEKSISSMEGYLFRQLLLKYHLFEQHKAADYKSRCAVEVTDCHLDIQEHVSKSHHGHIRNCDKTIVHYIINKQKSRKKFQGELMQDPCGTGSWYFVPIESSLARVSTNMFLIKIDNYKPRNTFFNFNCLILNRVNAAGSFDIQPDPCRQAKGNKYQRKHVGGECRSTHPFKFHSCISSQQPIYSCRTAVLVVIQVVLTSWLLL